MKTAQPHVQQPWRYCWMASTKTCYRIKRMHNASSSAKSSRRLYKRKVNLAQYHPIVDRSLHNKQHIRQRRTRTFNSIKIWMRPSVYDNGTTVCHTDAAYGGHLKIRTTLVRGGCSLDTSPDHWLHIRIENIDELQE